VSVVMQDHAKDGKRCGGAALTHRGWLQLGFGWRSQLRTAGGDLRLVLKAQQRRARCWHDSRGLAKLDVEQRRATTYGNREMGERGGELQPGVCTRRRGAVLSKGKSRRDDLPQRKRQWRNSGATH
jgi:hypothetical protein